MSAPAPKDECRGHCLEVFDLVQDPFRVGYGSVDCLNLSVGLPVCLPQPCQNIEICNTVAPAAMYDKTYGLCTNAMPREEDKNSCWETYGRTFCFVKMVGECPLCYEAGKEGVEYECDARHQVCAQCYGKTNTTRAMRDLMRRCPVCRKESFPKCVKHCHGLRPLIEILPDPDP